MVLSTSVDATYADDGSDASVKQHQQDHDTVHGAVNALAGGTTGQVWQKTGSADYAAGWTTPGYGGGDTFRTGYYYFGSFGTGSFSSLSPTAAVLYVRPFWVAARHGFDLIAVNVSVAAAAGSGGLVRMGVYGPGAGVPGALLVDAGTASTETTGVKAMTIALTLDPGVYWLALVAQVATCTFTAFPTGSWSPYTGYGTSPISAGNAFNYWTMNGVSGALGTYVAASNTSSAPAVMLRAT